MFDRAQVKDVPYCVTYDPSPSAPGPLAVKMCGKSSAHQSQLFEFSTTDGSVRPIWATEVGESSEVASQSSEQSPFERESIANEAAATDFALTNTTSVNSTAAAPVSSVSNATHVVPKGAVSPPRSVALMFAPDDPQAPKVASEDAIPNNVTTSSSPQVVRTTISGSASTSSAVAQDASVATSSTHASTTSSGGASAAAATSPSSTATSSSATGSALSSKVLAADAKPTSTDTSASSATVRAADAAAPYEWMFTPGV